MRLADAEDAAGLFLQSFDIADALVGDPIVLRHDHQLSGKRKPVQYSNRRLGKTLPQIVAWHLWRCPLASSIPDLVWNNIAAASIDQVRWEAGD